MRSKIRYLLVGVLVGAILVCPAMAASLFPDVDEYVCYAEAVELVNDAGIMCGDDKGNFSPNKTVTRAEMATIVCRMLDETENLAISNTFTDVPNTHWANKYIVKAAELSIVNGYGNGKFGPNDPVTYEQAVTMVVRAVGRTGRIQVPTNYPDDFLQIALDNDWLDGISAEKGEFLSRADIAVLIYNYYMNTATIM